jgi:hypothetical protein
MRNEILYVPEHIVLDLSRPDLGHVNGYDIVRHHHRQGSTHHPEYHRGNPAFVCIPHIGGTNPGLYIKKIDGEWFAAHYESGSCKDHRLPSPMSDEHKRQTEYWARAAEDAGWSVDLEHDLGTGTRPDALISGGTAPVGVEVQRSSMTAPGAVSRTRKAMAAGVLDVWYSGADIHFVSGKPTPPWAFRVPTSGSAQLPWKALPPRRAAFATGLREIQARRCVVGNFDRCPVRGSGWCGKAHPAAVPWLDMFVDDVAAMIPAGEIAPIRYRRSTGKNDVLLVSLRSLALYEDMTGRPALLDFHPRTEDRPPARPTGAIECVNEQAVAQLPMFTLRPEPPARPGMQETVRRTAFKTRMAEVCADCHISRVSPGQQFCQACKVIAKMRGETR